MNLTPTMKDLIKIAYELGAEDFSKYLAGAGQKWIAPNSGIILTTDEVVDQMPHRGDRIIEDEVTRRVR